MKKKHGVKYCPQNNLEECIYTEKKPEKSNINGQLISPE